MSDIPPFGGRQVHGARLAFSGSVDGGPSELQDDDEVVFLVRGKVTKVSHATDSFGVRRRIHSVKVRDAVVATDSDAERLAKEVKRQQDKADGQASLDGEIDTEIDGA